MGDASIPFTLRGKHGEIRVSVVANDDSVGLGCDLLVPTLPPHAVRGYPVCQATPFVDLRGYAAACGWIQLVRSTDGSGEFELDPLSLFRDVDMPFAFFGLTPTLFDAPFRADRRDLAWRARSFLCEVPDAVMSKVVQPVCAFDWGFTVSDGVVAIEEPRALDLATWDEHTPLLTDAFPRWSFLPALP